MTTDPMSPVDELREAVAALRERANAAVSGPWVLDVFAGVRSSNGKGVASALNAHTATANYIAAMDPIVGLAVANWLDYVVGSCDPARANGLTGEPYDFTQAVAVARAILGTPPGDTSPARPPRRHAEQTP